MEKGQGDFEPSEVREEQVKIKNSKAKKDSRKFKSKLYFFKYAPLPFSQSVKKAKLESQFPKFLVIFKQLHINIPLIKMLKKIPKYVKFLMYILPNKKK